MLIAPVHQMGSRIIFVLPVRHDIFLIVQRDELGCSWNVATVLILLNILISLFSTAYDDVGAL